MELPPKQSGSPIQPIYLKIGPNWPNWQCCLAGCFKTAPRILIFSIAMGADYSFYVKTIETHARAFSTLNILAIGRVCGVILQTIALNEVSTGGPRLVRFLGPGKNRTMRNSY